MAIPACTADNLAISADARTVALVPNGSRPSRSGTCRPGVRTATLSADQVDPIAVEISADGSSLACAWADGTLQLFDVAAQRSVAVRHEHQTRIASLDVFPGRQDSGFGRCFGRDLSLGYVRI